MVSREVQFAFGGTLVLAALFPLAIAVLGSYPLLNLGLLINAGGLGLLMGFLGFFLMGSALFRSQ